MKDFDETGAKEEDCDGIVNIGRSIEGVEVSILMKEKENGDIKVNFRSKTYVDVAEIAFSFNGGGHKRAAGCTVNGSINEMKVKILDAVREKL
jgi:phosphoesterase RecJ-like protein